MITFKVGHVYRWRGTTEDHTFIVTRIYEEHKVLMYEYIGSRGLSYRFGYNPSAYDYQPFEECPIYNTPVGQELLKLQHL